MWMLEMNSFILFSKAEKLIYNNIICYSFNSNDYYNYYFYGYRDCFLKKKKK